MVLLLTYKDPNNEKNSNRNILYSFEAVNKEHNGYDVKV